VSEVLAHSRATFHLCTCGLCGGVATVIVALIGYDNEGVTVAMTTRRQS
jgi:hypothetical protein